jgi:hypothetical protein
MGTGSRKEESESVPGDPHRHAQPPTAQGLHVTGCHYVVATQIKQDVTSSIETCMQLAKNDNRAYALVDSVKIASTKIYNNEATVRVSIEYHWVGTPTPADTFTAPPRK